MENELRTIEMAITFHESRDLMNAALHMEAVHYSPLTLALRDAMAAIKKRFDVYKVDAHVNGVQEIDTFRRTNGLETGNEKR